MKERKDRRGERTRKTNEEMRGGEGMVRERRMEKKKVGRDVEETRYETGGKRRGNKRDERKRERRKERNKEERKKRN